MSKLEVDKVDPQSGTALEIGTSGDTITVPTGAGLTVVDEVKTNKISPATGTAFTLGDSGDTFTVPSGATLANLGTTTGFAGISWQSVVTAATLTAVAGRGYPINTTSNACTITLPAAASVGDQIIFTDYLRTWGTYAVTIDQNSLKFQGYTTPNPVYDTEGESVHIVYMDATQGWVPINDGAVANETNQAYDSEYLIIAGGGGGGAGSTPSDHGGAGGGAGGYRTNFGSTAVELTPGVSYTITVGTGGPAAATASTPVAGSDGTVSSIAGSGLSTVSATGGGGGGSRGAADGGIGRTGGSGGGSASYSGTPAAGNAGGDGGSPSIPEGFAGGNYASNEGGAGGGGSSVIGTEGTSNDGSAGGAGTANSITGGSVTYAGGGGGGSGVAGSSGGAGGSGGGGAGGASTVTGSVGTDGLGGGGGAGGKSASGGDGGNGRVILRVATGDVGTPSGEDSSAVDGSDTVITWLATGSYVA